MLRYSLSAIIFAALPPLAMADDLGSPGDLGRRLTLEDLKTQIVGNSWTGTHGGKSFSEFIAPNGELRGKSAAFGAYVAHWHFRDEDGLFCVDYGQPGMRGCVTLLRAGDQVTFRRLDGVVEGTNTLVAGNAFGL